MEILLKNLSYLSHSLKEKLLNLDEESKNAFKIVEEFAKNERGESIIYKNFYLEGGGVFDYKECEERLKEFQSKYRLYPVLYFYGISNAFLLQILFKNPSHCHFIVYEKNLSLLYAVLSCVDVSSQLKEKRLLIFDTMQEMEFLCHTQPFLAYSRTYFLELSSGYYAKDEKEILALNTFLMQGFKQSVLAAGNDPQDALQGIRQFVYNLDAMIQHPSLKTLKLQRKAKFKSCVIVSTGPSLTKQLPLLKEAQERVVIFAADSAYPILMQNDIVPDYVCMVERTDFTAEFFKHDFGAKDDKTTFLLASLVHPNAITYLEQRHKNYMLVPKNLNFARYVDLKSFGLLESALSVAHMALILALELEFKNIVFIGQDLAYNELGHSHPKNYQHGANYESEHYKLIEILAYGGKGVVKSHFMWIFFKQILENLIKEAKNVKIYNATEGGARIEGTIEKSFKQCCESFDEDKTKLTKLQPFSQDKQKELSLKAYAKVSRAIKECVKLKEKLEIYYQEIEPEFLSLNTLEIDAAILKSGKLMQKLDDFRNDFDLIPNLFYELLHAFFVQFNINLNKILVLNPLSKEDLFNKNVLCIKEHLDFMQNVFGFIHAQQETLKYAITPLENALKTKNLNKYQERLKG